MLLLLLLTHLCFSSSGLLDETSRHGGADRVALEEASHCITETQRHQLLQQRHKNQHWNTEENRLWKLLYANGICRIKQVYGESSGLPGYCPPCIHVSVQMFFQVK